MGCASALELRLRGVIVVVLGLATAVGCGDNRTPGPPSALTYATNPAVYTRAHAIAANLPSHAGGAVEGYAVAPSLPTGLGFDAATGIIAGTPLVLSASATYTVTASNSYGAATTALTIAVNDEPPAALIYAPNPATYTRGSPIAASVPSSRGGAVLSYTINPALPAGLDLAPETGVITGTPIALAPMTRYTVTASNSGGSAEAAVAITVNDIPPAALRYATDPLVATQGQALADDAPTSLGGAAVAYAIDPALPAGLAFDSTTGIVSGTPTVVSPATSYTVTASNSGGSTTATIRLEVKLGPPTALTYAANPAVYTRGQPIPDNSPASGGGAVASYAISPSLPAGLALDPATGVVTGTPGVLSPATTYTVTARNAVGSTLVALALTVVDAAPAALTYATARAIYTRGQTIASNTPASTGGAVASYAISPALPAGLALDPASGIISGTPSALSPAVAYTITATNSGGSTTATVEITVDDVAPSAVSYPTNPASYMIGQAIIDNAPSHAGGAVVSWAISPALPAGLAFSAITGAISGTPTAVASAASYTVTATNSGGSAMATITVSVKDGPPVALSYAINPATYTRGHAIASNVPSSSGGAVTAYAISPALPAGLVLAPSTGIISGTPTALSPSRSYTVTATNSGGSTTAVVTLTVNDAPPAALTYATNPVIYGRGLTAAPDVPSATGGPVVTYAINPSLPAGLVFSPTTGIVSGLPTALTAARGYTITATNSGGSTTTTLTLTVLDFPPTNLGYATSPAGYVIGVAIAPNTPSAGGSPITSYTIAPPLPAGLSFDGQTGVIAGAPTALAAAAGHTVTASNSGGSTTASVSIAVGPGGTAGMAGTLAAGDKHSCALINGGVSCWGANGSGQLGNNTTSDSHVPIAVEGITGGVAAIATGAIHSCALVNGGVQCWGGNGYGQLGNNATVDSHVPVAVLGLSHGVQAIAAGAAHTCALIDGGVRCWGANPFGQLGNNTTTDSRVPVQVAGLTAGVQALVAGYNHTCALVNGGVQCWGYNPYGQLGNNTTVDSDVPVAVTGLATGVQALAAGWLHTCALVNGSVQCWGNNQYGALGNNTVADSHVPVAVLGLVNGVQAVAAGAAHSCAIVTGGVQCWGRNLYNQLGNASNVDSRIPVAVAGLGGGAQVIAAGDNHSCALVNGGVRCWGDNGNGDLGNNSIFGSPVPVQVVGLTTGVQAVAAGDAHGCALVSGSVQCWGDNGNGQLGNNATTDSHVPVRVTGLATGVQTVSPGGSHTCAVVNGGVRCWGGNSFGQLGNSSAVDSHVPVEATGMSSGAQAVAAGRHHSCALVNGGVQCWGSNSAGQLGNNATADSHAPVAVSGLTSGVQAIAANGDSSCALVAGGVRCWGANALGQLGNNSTLDSRVPVQVVGLASSVQAIALGDDHACAIVNGGARCWGGNGFGALGDGTLIDSHVPVAVSGLSTGVQALAVALHRSCAGVDGGVVCWGSNASGGLGNGSTVDSRAPVAVAGLTGAVAITAGVAHGCALVNGGVQCWGENASGELGNNATTDRLVPVQLSAWAP